MPTESPPTGEAPRIHLPRGNRGAAAVLTQRLGWAVGLIAFQTVVAYLGRGGYVDQTTEGGVGLFDCLYYATVSITTTGYGDIVPVSDGARLATAVLITPARVLFLILLVGTTVELLAERSRQAIAEQIWRRRLNDHVIVCGYGTKGHTAIEVLLGQGTDAKQVVVIDSHQAAIEHATEHGFAAIHGNASQSAVLRAADIADARAVIVAPDRDDTAVLITLTARELNPTATITSAVREEENVHLLRQSGANSVITSSAAAGRLLGLSAENPRSVEVLEDLLSIGRGLDLVEHKVTAEDAGPRSHLIGDDLLVGVVRGQELLRFDDERTSELRAGDCVVLLRSHKDP